jgi:hypothetical protein
MAYIGSNAFFGCTNLMEVKFENVQGWQRNNNVNNTLQAISSVDLSDDVLAARYLRNTFVSLTWMRTGE